MLLLTEKVWFGVTNWKGENPMGSKREFLRVNCDSACVIDYKGTSHQALLENLSLGGALIKVGNDLQLNLQIGDLCGLMLCSNPDMCPTKYSCMVTRIDSADVGIFFLKDK